MATTILLAHRCGSWSTEGEAYAVALIQSFLLGYYPTVLPGTSLRVFLAHKLDCLPMRISKKLAQLHAPDAVNPKHFGRLRYVCDPSVLHGIKRQAARDELDLLVVSFDKVVEVQRATPIPRPFNTAPSARAGPWSDEEQDYTYAMISYFIQGHLGLPDGTSLRAHLSRQLECTPMRVSKKLSLATLAGHALPRRVGTLGFVANIEAGAATGRNDARAHLVQLRSDCFDDAGLVLFPINGHRHA
ncbi:hypothetical protein SPRG_16316 [Saprolegnia parasitica CBS 223.65]|uniref:Uncharacterized protein n=1 Tax=Saprolegnia parasitica (strain CBS 223.65) TaxID=695850 RepID=A0A067BIS2_SAPPC|nr:hypothetical protein SPRG_16316 [Saprolegnia parasitica CBS 223.65]KDO18294.1 hypothetical protein SPRG_16316 [Saprolegnia parasitica CBS 223.65]|eukprot:XP_012211002.1 hypothetical protein SPRG_16316 [Saprolegnia parasitica CBS 223.65]